MLAYETARAIMDYPLDFRQINSGIAFNGNAPANNSLYQTYLNQLVTHEVNYNFEGQSLPVIYSNELNDRIDLILVMRDGDIIEQGKHEELLQKGGFYASLYNSQFEQATA